MQHKLRIGGRYSAFPQAEGACALRGACDQQGKPGWHDHHVTRRVDGGLNTLGNRVLLHPNCHALVHSRQEKVTLRHGGLK